MENVKRERSDGLCVVFCGFGGKRSENVNFIDYFGGLVCFDENEERKMSYSRQTMAVGGTTTVYCVKR